MSSPEDIRVRAESVRSRALSLGFDACGITSAAPPESGPEFLRALGEGRHAGMEWLARNAERRLNPGQVLPGARSVVLVASSYAGAEDFGIQASMTPQNGAAIPTASGVIARYAQYPDYHDLLAPGLRALSAYLDELGGPGSRSLAYLDTGPILERDLGQRAGLGFVGKHTGLISRELGNWFLIGEVLTTVELATDSPGRNRCGSCSRCLESCPTGALPAPFTLDARRCISYLTIELKGSIPEDLRPLIGNRIFGCDDCLAACPWNRFAREGALMKSHQRTDLATPDLLNLLELDNAAFKANFRGTPILRTKRRGLLRNVCVALGNVGNAAALPTLRRAAADPEPLIAEHAQWAIRQIEGRTTGIAQPG